MTTVPAGDSLEGLHEEFRECLPYSPMGRMNPLIGWREQCRDAALAASTNGRRLTVRPPGSA